MAGSKLCPAHVVDFGEHFSNEPNASFDRFPDASTFLDGQDWQFLLGSVQLDESFVFNEVDRLSRFAAEAHENVCRYVWVLREPSQGSVELLVVSAIVLHGAAGLVGDRHDSVDLLKLL